MSMVVVYNDERRRKISRMLRKRLICISLLICLLWIATSGVEIIVGINMLINGMEFSKIHYDDGVLLVELQTKYETTTPTKENCKMIMHVYNHASKQKIIADKIEEIRLVIRNKNGYPYIEHNEKQGTKVTAYWIDPSEDFDLWSADRWNLPEQ